MLVSALFGLLFAVLTMQNPGSMVSPYAVVAAQPQTLNAITDFNEIITNHVLAWSMKDGNQAALAAVAADGVRRDSAWISG